MVGFAQQTLLKQIIGLSAYGALSRVMLFSNIANNVIVSSSIQGVSRAVAHAGTSEKEAFRATLRVHLPIAIGAGLIFALGAPLMAAFEHSPHILAPLVLMSGVTGMYGIYAPLVGSLNGRRLFTRQAALDVTSAALRTVAILGLAYWFVRTGASGVLGATLGALVTAIGILPLALRWAGIGRAAEGPAASVPQAARYVAGLWPLAIAQLFTNLIMQSDLLLLGRFLSESAAGLPLSAVASTSLADEWVGVYRACQLFAFLPYQLLFSVTQVLFPMLARAKAEGDNVAVRAYVQRGARLAAIACGLLVMPAIVAPGSLIALAYGAEVGARGASTLRVLALGQGAFAMMGIATTVLASLGQERRSAMISLVALVLVSLACWLLVPSAAFGIAQLHATASATALALTGALVAAGYSVQALTGGFVPLRTALRVGAALALAFVAGPYVPTVRPVALIMICVGVVVAYGAFLTASRELTAEDAALLKNLLRRKTA